MRAAILVLLFLGTFASAAKAPSNYKISHISPNIASFACNDGSKPISKDFDSLVLIVCPTKP